jgi:hypothetical protein
VTLRRRLALAFAAVALGTAAGRRGPEIMGDPNCVKVVRAEGDIADAARDLNIGFFSRALRVRPWVRLKAACSLSSSEDSPSSARLGVVATGVTAEPARAVPT